MPLSGPFLIVILIPGCSNWYLTGSFLIGAITFIIQFFISPFVTGKMLANKYMTHEQFDQNPGWYAGQSNLIVGSLIVILTAFLLGK
tara:strand:+ start:187 stop:447 length:261 start_codon:yes stop_codon:yes gene_type:complete